MTYDAQELSIEAGQPVELYEFSIGGEAFNLTSAEDDLTIASVDYTPVELARSSINLSPEQRAELLQISMPADHAFPRKFVNSAPGFKATLTIKRFHRTDGALQTIVLFKGVVRSVGFSLNGVRAEIAVLPLTAAMSRTVPRFLYSNLCNHILYDARCKVVENAFRFVGSVSVISGNDYTIPGVGASVAAPTAGGFIKAGGGIDYRLVLSQTGDVLTLLLPFDLPIVQVGTVVEVFAGCKHDIATCKTQFNNVVNYGGFAFVPIRNPFESGL